MIPKKIPVLLGVALLVGSALYHHWKPLPAGVSVAWPERVLEDPKLLIDHTWVDENGEHRLEHEIFDEALRLIGQARRLIVVDMFLFNPSGGGEGFRPLSRELTDALLARRAAVPDIPILVISDAFNTQYGGIRSTDFERLRAAGIPVVETRLGPLRDPNPLWSSLWRLCCQWFGNDPDGGWLPSPISEEKVPLRSYLALLNFKANHRKVLVVDEDNDLRGLVSSANPHDGSSRHSNVALTFAGPAARDLLDSELAVAALSGVKLPVEQKPIADKTVSAESARTTDTDGQLTGQIVTEDKVRDAVLAMIDGTGAGDRVDLAMFYLSHRGVVEALIQAHQRGVTVRVLLDANKDAFGMEKDGVPNRPVARDLHRAGVPVRWSNTHGEQFHTKALMRRDTGGAWQLLLGSTNFTRRNLDDYNLETNILARGTGASPVGDRFAAYFEQSWQQGPDQPVVLSVPYKVWRDESSIKYWRYRVMEATGLSTF